MDNMWLLLLVAGLVVGVAFFAVSFLGGTGAVPPATDQPETDREFESEFESQEYQGAETEAGGKVESLDFRVDVTRNGEDVTYRFRINAPETEHEDVRVDHMRDDGSEFNLILRHGKDEGWVKELSSDQWTHFTGIAFTQMARTRAEDYSAYQVTDWRAMEGETFTVETEEGPVKVYDVRVNEEIPESVFLPD